MLFPTLFTKKQKNVSSIAAFMRETNSAEKKRVFMKVLKKASEDQAKILHANR